MNSWELAKCGNCGYSYLTFEEDYDHKCEMCENISIHFIEYEDIQDVDVILEIISNELENANYHSITQLPYELYHKIKNEEHDEVGLARTIAKVFYDSI